MNKYFLSVCIAIIISNYGFAQITKTKTIEEKEEIIYPYDSLTNISINNFKSHIGQTLYLRDSRFDKSVDVKSGGSFKIKPDFEFSENNIYKQVVRNAYEGSDYNAVTNKYYLVNKVIENPKKSAIFPDKREYYLELIIQEEPFDTIYFRFDNWSRSFDSFLTVGYFVKLKERLVGKEMIYTGNYNRKLKELGTGEEVEIPQNTKFLCTDVTIEDGNIYSIILILENPKFNKLYFTEADRKNVLETPEEYEVRKNKLTALINKYGRSNASLIVNGEVQLGMNKAMCKEAWGEPYEINKTTGSFGTHEQWVYGYYNYLYFENGILTTIQN